MVRKNKHILDLELRNKIFCMVTKYAGCHLRDLERKSGIAYSTLKYHLHYLTKHDLIIEQKVSGNSQYYPKTIEYSDIKILSLLRQKNIRRIIVLLISENTCSLHGFESYVKLGQSTILWYLDKLIKNSIVEKIRRGKNTFYKLKYDRNKIIKLLISYQKSFLDNLVDKTIEMWEV